MSTRWGQPREGCSVLWAFRRNSTKKSRIFIFFSLALLDFSLAFDTIDHPIHIHHLHTDFGITDTVLQWFSSYLTVRTQYVSLCNHCSAFSTVHSGAPQGSVLGPILFTMYIKPLSAIIDPHSIIHHSSVDALQLQMSAPLIEYLSYFTLYGHAYVMSRLGKLRTCINLMTTRQKSCLSPLIELSISITYPFQSLWEMLKLPSNSLWRILVLH